MESLIISVPRKRISSLIGKYISIQPCHPLGYNDDEQAYLDTQRKHSQTTTPYPKPDLAPMDSQYSCQWNPGMALPPARDPCKNWAEAGRLEKVMGDDSRNTGIATPGDTMIMWMCDPPKGFFGEAIKDATYDMVTLASKETNLPYVWILCGVHDQEYQQWQLVDTDFHITVRLGTGPYDRVLSAHIWVVVDQWGIPQRLAQRADRTPEYIRYECGEPITYWHWVAGIESQYWPTPLGEKSARIFPPGTSSDIADVYVGGQVPPRERAPQPPCGAQYDPCCRCQGRWERDEAYNECVRDAEDALRHSRSRQLEKEGCVQKSHLVTDHQNPNRIPIPFENLRITR